MIHEDTDQTSCGSHALGPGPQATESEAPPFSLPKHPTKFPQEPPYSFLRGPSFHSKTCSAGLPIHSEGEVNKAKGS